MMMSAGWKYRDSSAIVDSVWAAGTMIHATRGVSSAAVKSEIEWVATAPSAASFSTASSSTS